MRPVLPLLAAFWACSGSRPAPRVPQPPNPATRAALAGPLCAGDRCTCRAGEESAGAPEKGLKRFEFVLGPTQHELWAEVAGQVLYKSVERAKECFYIDLPPGEHRVALQARGEAGFGARLRISEQGENGPWWYDTFEFFCGAPGLCDRTALREWKRHVSRFSEGKHDPCGSVRVRGIDWQTGRMPDNLHPEDFRLALVLKIYNFIPDDPPGDPSCAGGAQDIGPNL